MVRWLKSFYLQWYNYFSCVCVCVWVWCTREEHKGLKLTIINSLYSYIYYMLSRSFYCVLQVILLIIIEYAISQFWRLHIIRAMCVYMCLAFVHVACLFVFYSLAMCTHTHTRGCICSSYGWSLRMMVERCFWL